jgi:magnesium-transporting ATPase (P-type)
MSELTKGIYLKQKLGIYCLNPKRIAIAGKIRVFCFDKTGTLTKNGLEFIGVQSLGLQAGDGRPSFQKGPSAKSTDRLTTYGLATCHAITRFGDQYVGNEVEVCFFTQFGTKFTETTLTVRSDTVCRLNFLWKCKPLITNA